MRGDHLGSLLTNLFIQLIAVVRTTSKQILRLRFNHVEVERQLHERDFMVQAARVVTAGGES